MTRTLVPPKYDATPTTPTKDGIKIMQSKGSDLSFQESSLLKLNYPPTGMPNEKSPFFTRYPTFGYEQDSLPSLLVLNLLVNLVYYIIILKIKLIPK